MPKNAIDLLKEDHAHVRRLLEQLADTTSRAAKTRADLLEKIARELGAHTRIEEEIFYPAYREAGGSEHNQMFFEATEEHRAVDSLVLPDLQKTDVQSDSFSGRCKVLKELVLHHVEEEEQELFPQARKSMDRELLLELGERMAERKKELMKQL
ncbi:MAG TPA: hemerythrin domain-containing protein [Pseudomonadales bacterium]